MSEDLQATGQSMNGTSPSSPSAGQSSDNWESRFKGLQRKYSTLQSQVEGKDDVINNIRAQLDEERSKIRELTGTYEGQLSELRSDMDRVSKEFAQTQQERDKLSADMQKRNNRDTVRKQLSSEAADLLPWFEAGFLNPVNDDGTPMEEEDFKSYVGNFREMQNQRSKSDFQSALKGSTPTPQETTGNAPGGMSVSEMHEWLNTNNFDNPQYNQIHDAYIDAIATSGEY